MSLTTISQHKYFTVIATSIFILALFPGLPQYLLWLPFRLLIWGSSSQPPSPVPTINCPEGCIPSSSFDTTTINTSPGATMSWFQKTFTLPAKSRGSYLITDQVVSSLPELKEYKVGILNLFVQHTSCALSLNENWDSDVREDMSDALDRIAPEDRKGELYRHSAEGLDDMPVGSSRVYCLVCPVVLPRRGLGIY